MAAGPPMMLARLLPSANTTRTCALCVRHDRAGSTPTSCQAHGAPSALAEKDDDASRLCPPSYRKGPLCGNAGSRQNLLRSRLPRHKMPFGATVVHDEAMAARNINSTAWRNALYVKLKANALYKYVKLKASEVAQQHVGRNQQPTAAAAT